MKNVYDQYALGLRLSHLALLRNLERFARCSAEPPPAKSLGDLGDFVTLCATFLGVHHDAEETELFPALRKSGAGKSTDAAHLDQWSTEHRSIHALMQSLVRIGEQAEVSRSERAGRPAQREPRPPGASRSPLRLRGGDPLEPALPEMIPAAALEEVKNASARKNRSQALALATFFVHSLAPEEQRALMGDTPWLFRKVALGLVGERRMARFRPFVHTATVAL